MPIRTGQTLGTSPLLSLLEKWSFTAGRDFREDLV
jgi:hypothetical protein